MPGLCACCCCVLECVILVFLKLWSLLLKYLLSFLLFLSHMHAWLSKSRHPFSSPSVNTLSFLLSPGSRRIEVYGSMCWLYSSLVRMLTHLECSSLMTNDRIMWCSRGVKFSPPKACNDACAARMGKTWLENESSSEKVEELYCSLDTMFPFERSAVQIIWKVCLKTAQDSWD